MGYHVFPCVSGDKIPLTEHGFYDASTDAEKVEGWWTARPDANVAIATEGLIVIDRDGENNLWPADPNRKLQLAAAPMSLTPRGGNHSIFRQPTGKTWGCTTGQLADRVDPRGRGGYIVAPPSVVGVKPYRWAPGLELDVPPGHLPEPPAWLAELLDEIATKKTDLGELLGADGKENPIPDGVRRGTLLRLAGTMRRAGMSGAEILAALARVNEDRCVPPLGDREVEKLALDVAARYRPDEVEVALIEDQWKQMYAVKPEAVAVEEEAVAPPSNPDPGAIPGGLLRVPGFIGDVVEYALRTAPYPEPVLAFCGALSLQCLLAGRKVRDPYDNRTNLYVLALANSGAGKDHPRKVNAKTLLACELADSLGDTFASGEGIEDRLFVNPAVLFQTDEIDGLMSKITLGKDARHEGIMSVLLKLYSSANTVYPMRAKVGKEPGLIDQPHLCVYGTSIPGYFYQALAKKMLDNGFFPGCSPSRRRDVDRGRSP
jgi:hypothetical protein